MILVGFIYINNSMTYMNPTLNLMGYKVYNVRLKSMSNDKEFNSILIAKKNIVIKEKTQIKATGKQDFVFVEKSLEDD